MGRVEVNRKILEVWRDAGTKNKSFEEMNARLLAQQNAILADISRSLAVIADKLNEKEERPELDFRVGSDDGEEKGL